MSHDGHNDFNVEQVKGAVAAGTTDVEDASEVDASGCYAVTFLYFLGAITATAVTKAVIKGGDVSGTLAALTDREGNAVEFSIADDKDNLVVKLTVYHPKKRYLRPDLDRGTANAVLNCIGAIRHLTRPPASIAGEVDGGVFHDAA